MKNKNIFYRLSCIAYEDDYLKKLIYSLEKRYCENFLSSGKIEFDKKKIYDLLRFSDILSRSSSVKHRNLSLKIISLIYEFTSLLEDTYIKLSIINTLTKLGNFPSLNMMDFGEYTGVQEIDYDLMLKSLINASPLGVLFTDGQSKVFNELKNRNHYSFSGGTSFGKSFIFEAFTKYLIDEHNQSDNIAYIVPTKALINQVSYKLRKIVKGKNYKIVSTPKIPKVLLKEERKYIFVFTPERLISYLLNVDNPQIDYLFVDEAHKLLNRKDTRTPLLYHALVMARRKSVNIYFASPNVPNPSVFLELVNNSTEESCLVEELPVSQNRFFINCFTDEVFMISDFSDDIYFPKLGFIGNPINDLKIILNTFSKNRQSIVYCNTVDKTIYTALDYANKLPDCKDERLESLITFIDDKVHSQYYLKTCLKKGVAYHFGGIPEEIKLQVEELYKNGIIKTIFCTSTLLEGVNLPAKNIFILSEKIGMSNMTDIDFWNLAGRAGRLSRDLSGNIFCVNLYNKQGYWKDSKKVNILRDKNIDKIEPLIMAKNNQNLYKNISRYYLKKEYTNKSLSETEKKMIGMYGNILMYHDSINSDSILKDNFIDSDDDSLEVLKKVRSENKVPELILAESMDIDIKAQNKIIIHDSKPLPTDTSYQGCLNVLEILFDEYNWLETEGKGSKPMIKSKAQLKYYAGIMEGWINSKPLKYLIQRTINYYQNYGNPRSIFLSARDYRRSEQFDSNNQVHINTLINDLMNDLENIIRFKVKSYVSNYQSILEFKNIVSESNWEEYLDYGTTDPVIIQIQNLGFSRITSILLNDSFCEVIIKDSDSLITDINDRLLKKLIDKNKHPEEYNELSNLYEWDN